MPFFWFHKRNGSGLNRTIHPANVNQLAERPSQLRDSKSRVLTFTQRARSMHERARLGLRLTQLN